MDYGTYKETCIGNGGLGNQFQVFHKGDSSDDMLHEAFNNMSGHETLVIDKNWPKKDDFYGFENYAEFSSMLNLVKVDTNSNVNEGEITFSSITEYSGSVTGPLIGAVNSESMSENQQMKRKRVDGCESLKTSTSDVKVEFCSLEEGDKAGIISPKRSRKPPRRYIEESLDYESKFPNRKCGIGRKSRDRILHDRYHKYKWQKEFHAEEVVYEDDSFNGGCIQVPFGLPMEKEHPKKNKSSLVSAKCFYYEVFVKCCYIVYFQLNKTTSLFILFPKSQICV